MFSVGCILGELITGKVMFRGDSEIDQLFKIFQLMGTPEDFEINDLSSQPPHRQTRSVTDRPQKPFEGIGP